MKKLSIIALLFASVTLFADIWMPAIFSDNMVLQAGSKNKLWGTAEANAKVEVKVGSRAFKTKADEKGNWSVYTSKLPVDVKGKSISVLENGAIKKEIKDVLVGEVWVLGGQSNMQWPVSKTPDYNAAKGRTNPNIRIFKQSRIMAKTPQINSPKGALWEKANEKSIAIVSAVGYYFGEMLLKQKNVPVGLIETSLGGSMMQAWIPTEKFTTEHLKTIQTNFNKQNSTYDYKKAMATYKKKLKEFDDAHKGKKLDKAEQTKRNSIARKRPNPISPRRSQETPSYLYNALIAPICDYSVRGVLWYQGCSDAYGPFSRNFDTVFEVLINSWREAWKNPNMPFYFVQLPSFETNATWPLVRAQQLKVSKKMKNVHMVCTVDTGEQKDIHPQDKMPISKRLFDKAMQYTYNVKNATADYAEAVGAKYDGSKAVVKFKIYKAPITAKAEKCPVEVKTSDGKWVVADAKVVSKNTIEITANADIFGVRYAWKNWAKPDVWLFTENGLPVIPFSFEKK